MKVKFDKHGFYHPAFGRLGRGNGGGLWYTLPSVFAEQEDIVVPLMDNTSKPPRKVGEKKITRYKYLPQSATIFKEDAEFEAMQKQLEDEGEEVPKAVRPKQASDAGEYMPGAQAKGKAQGAIERTTGKSPSRKA